MSHRLCAGFNWPPLSIPAQEPVSISPEAVSRAGPGSRCTAISAVLICGSVGLRPDVIGGRGLASTTVLFGVGQPARYACAVVAKLLPGWARCSNFTLYSCAFCVRLRLSSAKVGVGQPANPAQFASVKPKPLPLPVRSLQASRRASIFSSLAWANSFALGVGHPVEPVPDVRRTDARRRKRDRPEGVIQGFQVSAYKVDPRVCVFACNLLSKDDCRLALFDEVMEVGPQVPLVIKPSSLACRAERLARTGASPNRSVVAPSGRPEGMGPNANPGEKVALCETAQVAWVNIFNTPFIDIAWRDMASVDQVTQPLRSAWVYLVVVGGHTSNSSSS